MRVLHLFDAGFATHEHALRARLELGLADEGVRVFTALPEAVGARTGEADELFSTALAYGRAGPFTTRRSRAAGLIARIEDRAATPAGERTIDVVHAFGGLVWEMAVEIGRQTGAAVVCEVWRSGLLGRARALRPIAGQGIPVALATPSETLAAELNDIVSDVPVRVTPWGVPAGSERPGRDSGEAFAAMISASGRDSARLRAVVEAFAVFESKHPGSIAFMDGSAAARSPVWTWITDLGLADRVSIVGSFAEGRDLVLRGSALLVPEALGEYRSLTLEAMAAGMPVIASADPRVAWLREGETAWTVNAATSDAWVEALDRLVDEPDASADLARTARAAVATNHRISGHVASVLGLYEWLLAEPSIPFAAPAR